MQPTPTHTIAIISVLSFVECGDAGGSPCCVSEGVFVVVGEEVEVEVEVEGKVVGTSVVLIGGGVGIAIVVEGIEVGVRVVVVVVIA